MASNGVNGDSELYQDVLSQFPFLNGYNQVTCGYQLAPEATQDAVASALKQAMSDITTAIPLVGGQVIHEPGPEGSTGRYYTAPWPEDSTNEIVRVRDCTSILPSVAQIIRAGAPMSIFPADVITPCPGLPAPHGLDNPVPIVIIQANFIRGGIILTFNTHHNVIDAAGTLQIMRMLAARLKNQDLSPSDLEQANRDRSRVVPLIPPNEPKRDYTFLYRQPGWTPSMPSSPFKWCEFRIAVSGLATLRKEATSNSSMLFSEDDVLSAWCWKRLSTVRVARGIPSSRVSKYARAIDGRSAMGIPSGYLGHMIHHAVTSLPLSVLISSPLSVIAESLRKNLKEANTSWALRSYATFLASEPDKSKIIYGSPRNPDTDLACSSNLANEAGPMSEGANFGPLLGARKFARRPSSAPIPGCMYFQPPEGNGVLVMACLPEEDIAALKRDGEWRRYMRFVS